MYLGVIVFCWTATISFLHEILPIFLSVVNRVCILELSESEITVDKYRSLYTVYIAVITLKCVSIWSNGAMSPLHQTIDSACSFSHWIYTKLGSFCLPIARSGMGVGGTVGFLVESTISIEADHGRVSSGWSITWLSTGTNYEQIPIRTNSNGLYIWWSTLKPLIWPQCWAQMGL